MPPTAQNHCLCMELSGFSVLTRAKPGPGQSREIQCVWSGFMAQSKVSLKTATQRLVW